MAKKIIPALAFPIRERNVRNFLKIMLVKSMEQILIDSVIFQVYPAQLPPHGIYLAGTCYRWVGSCCTLWNSLSLPDFRTSQFA